MDCLRTRAPRRGFSFGYGRVEDLAGVIIVGVLVSNALFAGYEAISRLIRPEPVEHLAVVVATAIVTYLGNEAVAILRIKVGREIGSAALVADGKHACVDGWTSLAVLAGVAGIRLGFPLVGLGITLVIFGVAWTSARTIFTRILDAVEPEVIDELRNAALDVTDVRARWIGHRLYTEANVVVSPSLTVSGGHAIASAVQHQWIRHVPHVEAATIHVCPEDHTGAEHHIVNTTCVTCELHTTA